MAEYQSPETPQDRRRYSMRLFARFTEIIANEFPRELFASGSPVWEMIGPDSDKVVKVAASYEEGRTSKEEFDSVAREVLHDIEEKVREFAVQQKSHTRTPRA